ncbi:hypothetical protein B7494_g1962 [Chlorociboria aeruginascens]|nr:hypothetical protein B7494_g1962 [Chlorociboria aeruginascens]
MALCLDDSNKAVLRRTGLTRSQAPLLRTIRNRLSIDGDCMGRQTYGNRTAAAGKATTKGSDEETLAPSIKDVASIRKDEEDKESVFRPPVHSSDEESPGRSADIIPTAFSGSASQSKLKVGQDTSKKLAGDSSTRKSGRKTTVVSSSPESPKRILEETKLGAGMADVFGRVVKKKKVTKGYGSSQSTAKPPKSSSMKPGDSPARPAFKVSKGFDDSDYESSPQKPLPLFKASEALDELGFEESPQKPAFKSIIGLDDDLESDEETLNDLPDTKPTKRGRGRPPGKKTSPDEMQATQRPDFKTYMDEFQEEDTEILQTKYRNVLAAETTKNEDSVQQGPRCPMCNQPVDSEELTAYGAMNTRQQEKFCRSHQKKTARADWASKGYPEIDWNRLETRLAKHHSYIKKLINGASCYYRELLEDAVNTGKDRSLMKMTTDLTPGYYGSRGLRVMSENIMTKFTPILKKRAPMDRLIAARTPIGFVQAVLVPEVVVLLIREDMGVDVDEARQILKDSIGVGELVHEEIRDVVVQKVADSEDDDDDELD